MPDVPQVLNDIFPAAADRAKVVGAQLAVLQQDLQTHQERQATESQAKGIQLLAAAAEAMRELAAAIDGRPDESERGQ